MFAKSAISTLHPNKILFCNPQFFEVMDVKNAHMQHQIGKTNKKRAILQWENLVAEYKKIAQEGGLSEVSILKGEEGLEDMVFAANQTFPFLDAQGNKKVLLSNMKHPNRQKEVPFYQQFFEQNAYEVLHLAPHLLFEGMGDLLPVPGTQHAICGHGFRTSDSTMDVLKQITQLDIVGLELVNPDFYHLDTCLVPLDAETVLYTPTAFSEQSNRQIKRLFSSCIEIPEEEARHGFALNMHVLRHEEKQWVILQEGNTETEKILRGLHMNVIPVDTSEYIMSGGSVFCLKMMYY